MRYGQLLTEDVATGDERNLERLDFIIKYLKDNPDYMARFHKVLKQKERDQQVASGNPDAVNIAAKLSPKITTPEKDHAPLVKRFIEAIDLLPTFLDAVESPVSKHRLEGNSLMPVIKGEELKNWKDFVFSEIDYSFNEARKILNLGASDARAFMIRNDGWKYIY